MLKFPVKSSTARISSHLSNRALLCLQPASAVVCLRHTLRFANSKQRMNKISPKPCHKKCRSANLRVCKSASLQVCRSASLQSAFVAHRLLGLLHDKTDKTEQGWKVYKNSRDPERFTWCLWLYMGESMTLEVMTLETWLKIHTNDCKLWQPPQKPYKLLIFFTISVIFMGKHSDFRISSFQVVYAWRILQFNWKNEIYLKGFIWFFRLHEEFRMIIFHGNRSW